MFQFLTTNTVTLLTSTFPTRLVFLTLTFEVTIDHERQDGPPVFVVLNGGFIELVDPGEW